MRLINIVLICIFLSTMAIQPVIASQTIVWDFYNRTGWGDTVQPDGDEHSNNDVWRYLTVDRGAGSDHTQYWQFPEWNQNAWRRGTEYATQEYWCRVDHDGVGVGDDYDSIVAFKNPYEAGYFDITVQMHRRTASGSNGTQTLFYMNSTGIGSISSPDPLDLSIKTFTTTVYLEDGDCFFLRHSSLGNSGNDFNFIDTLTLTGTFNDVEWYTIRDAGVTYDSSWDTSEIDDLFGLWSEQGDYIDIDGERWYYFDTAYSDREIGEYWVDEFGTKHIYLGGELTTAPVPEPATLMLLMLCIPSLIRKFLKQR